MNAAPPCLCGGRRFRSLFAYDAPPPGETPFHSTTARYRREIRQCEACRHFVSVHEMDLTGLYADDYVSSTYASGLRAAFDRINALPPEQSDNVGRVRRILAFARGHFGDGAPRRLLDVGSGLCVFLHRMKQAGWDGTALDIDARQVEHARSVAGVRAVQGEFQRVDGLGRYDAVTFNKVLEHVPDPVAMLTVARRHVEPGGFVYVEVPDGEAASAEGPHREEFFVDHYHVFSEASARVLAERADFVVAALERLREPSGKYTLRTFMVGRDA